LPQPILPGIQSGTSKAKLVFAQDIDWPPYAYLGVPPESDYDVAGFGHDVAFGMGEYCDIDVTIVQTSWAECWNAGAIGTGLQRGEFHACMTFTHTAGQRNRFAEFSHGILQANKPAGLLVMLNEDGTPRVDGKSNLDGLKVVDVTGWAPTSDGLAFVENKCTGQRFSGYEIISGPEERPNDGAMAMLQKGEVNAIWIYADQAYNYGPNGCDNPEVTSDWDCALWNGLGTRYAYVQTGLFGHTLNGTTLTLAKRGSGIADIVNPCLEGYMQTKGYYEVCKKHGFTTSCYPNRHFSGEDMAAVKAWERPTNEHSAGCSDGYCGCPAK